MLVLVLVLLLLLLLLLVLVLVIDALFLFFKCRLLRDAGSPARLSRSGTDNDLVGSTLAACSSLGDRAWCHALISSNTASFDNRDLAQRDEILSCLGRE